MPDTSVIPAERIEQAIYLIRGQKVMLDADLAALYGVETRALNRAVNRNIARFPEDFMFWPTTDEFGNLRRQFGTSNAPAPILGPRLRLQSGTSNAPWAAAQGVTR